MASLRDIFVRLGVKTDPKGFKRADQGLQSIVNGAKAAVVALAGLKIVGVVKGIADETRQLGDRLDKVSQQIGVSTDALQELEFAGGLAGAAANDVSTALRILARNSFEASTGAKEYTDNFDALGVSVTDGEGRLKAIDQILMDVADGMAGLSSDTERTALAQAVLGRSGAKLLPMLNQGSAAIRKQRQEAKELGLLSKKDIATAVKLTDNQLRLSRAFDAVKFAIARGILPSLDGATVGMTRFIRENRTLIQQGLERFFKRGAAVLKSLGAFISRAATTTRDWFSGLSDVSRQMLKLAMAAAALAVILLIPGASLLLLIGLVALLIDDFETWRKGGDSLIGDMIRGFKDLGTWIDTEVLQSFIELDAWLDETGASFSKWVEDNVNLLAALGGAVGAVALAIGVKFVAATAAATASTASLGATAVGVYALMAKEAIVAGWASFAAGAKAAAGWLLAAAPIVLTIAVIAALGALIAWLGLQIYKMLTGQRTVFNDIADWIWDLGGKFVDMFDRAMDAAKSWASRVGDVISGAIDTLMLPFKAAGRFGSFIAKKLGIGGGEPTSTVGAANPGALANALAPSAAVVSGPQRASVAASPANRGATVDNRNQSTVNVSVAAAPGMSEERLAEMIPQKIREEQDRQNRVALRDFAVVAP